MSIQYFAKAEMLIRKPIREVYRAFIDPEITTKFWFTKSSGALEAGQTVEWVWEMYNHTASVKVLECIPNHKILIDWGNYENPSEVQFIFTMIDDNSTFVSITNSGFIGETDKIMGQIRDSTEGFTLVLAGLKAWLEFGIQLNLVGDRFPH